MRVSILLWSAFACVSVCGIVAVTGFPPRANLQLTSLVPLAPSGPPCLVTPLRAIEDPAALAFESGFPGSSGSVDVADLTPGTARALARFQSVVTSKGGTLTVTSAYRPPAYQQHLQAVWDKWIHELRNNREPSCQQLRAEVGKEFTRHKLLETQRPVNFSDHTRGVAFDAAVTLPPQPAKRRSRWFALDKLARLCRLMRPDILHDPVHFRFALARRGHSA